MMEGRWDSAPPYALIIHSGDFDNKVCIPEKRRFQQIPRGAVSVPRQSELVRLRL